jgi:hypothetical protein
MSAWFSENLISGMAKSDRISTNWRAFWVIGPLCREKTGFGIGGGHLL